MFEDRTYNDILEESLDYIPDDIAKGEGSLVYNSASILALEVEKLYSAVTYLLEQLDPETAEYENLKRMAAARGIFPNDATIARFKVTADGAELPIGTRFSLGDHTFTITGKGDTFFIADADEPGADVNTISGDLEMVDYVEGLTSAKITGVYEAGKNATTREELLAEYDESCEVRAFGGNVKDYKDHISKMDGVSGCRVFPCPGKVATKVKCVLIGSDFGKIDADKIKKIQTEVCPEPLMGYGIAPIGHDVTIASVEEKQINIKLTIEYAQEKTWENVQAQVEAAIKAYLLSIRANWSAAENENEKTIVYKRQIEAAVLGVKDIKDAVATLNDQAENVELTAEQVPVLGTITAETKGSV